MLGQICMLLALDFRQLDLVKVANRSNHFVERHGARAVLVDFPKPGLELVAVEIGVNCVHFCAESLQPQLSLEYV